MKLAIPKNLRNSEVAKLETPKGDVWFLWCGKRPICGRGATSYNFRRSGVPGGSPVVLVFADAPPHVVPAHANTSASLSYSVFHLAIERLIASGAKSGDDADVTRAWEPPAPLSGCPALAGPELNPHAINGHGTPYMLSSAWLREASEREAAKTPRQRKREQLERCTKVAAKMLRDHA